MQVPIVIQVCFLPEARNRFRLWVDERASRFADGNILDKRTSNTIFCSPILLVKVEGLGTNHCDCLAVPSSQLQILSPNAACLLAQAEASVFISHESRLTVQPLR